MAVLDAVCKAGAERRMRWSLSGGCSDWDCPGELRRSLGCREKTVSFCMQWVASFEWIDFAYAART
jgi:hypothetical protein